MKKIIKQISILIAPLIVIAMAIFGTLKSLSNPLTNNDSVITQSSAVNPAPVATDIVSTPEQLFVTYPLPYQKGNDPKWPEALIAGLKATKGLGGSRLYSTLIAGELLGSFQQMHSATVNALKGDPINTDVFTKAKAVHKVNNFINGISTIDQKKTIRIKKPTKIWDPIRYSGNGGSFAANGATAASGTMAFAMPKNFYYKVASIDTTSVPDGKSIQFDMKDGIKDKMTLVIQNNEKQLGDKWNLKEMQEMGDIYYRRTDKPARKDSIGAKEALNKARSNKLKVADLPKGVTLVRDTTNDTISVYVEATATQFDFSINSGTDSAAKGAIKFGILDHSVSPLHTKAATSMTNTGGTVGVGKIDGTKPMFVASGSVDKIGTATTIKGFHRASEWKTVPGYVASSGTIPKANVLTVYMSEGAKIARKLMFNGKKQEAFEGDANDYSFGIGSGILSASPKSLKIVQAEFTAAGAVSPINLKVEEQEVTSASSTSGRKKTWFKVELAFTAGVTGFDQGLGAGHPEFPFVLEKLDENIFFSKPEGWSINAAPTIKNVSTPVTQYVDNSKENIKIIGSVYANWSGLYKSGDPDYIIRSGGKLPKFHIRHEGYTEEADGSLKHTGLQNEQWDPNEALVELNKFTNRMSDWSVKKLGADPLTVREADFYKMIDASTSGGFVRKRFMNGANAKDVVEVDKVVELARKWYADEDLEDEEDKYLNPFFKDVLHPEGTPIRDFGKHKSSGAKDAKSLMYEYIEPVLAKIISDRFEIEKATFDTLKSQLIAGDIEKYLSSSNGLTGINNKALKKVTKNIKGKNMELLALNGNPSIRVTGGKQQLKSLVEFVKDFDLQTKYLGEADAATFNQMVGLIKDPTTGKYTYDETKNSFIDKTIWANVGTAPQPIYDMVGLLDEIFEKISGNNQHYTTISSIIDDILSTKIKTGGKELGNLLNDIVAMVTSGKGAFEYSFFGRSFESSYMQNLAVGYNLAKTIKRYISDNEKTAANPNGRLSKDDITELGKVDSQTAYDPNVITRIGVNNKYYNIRFFIDGLSQESNLVETITDLLNADLLRNVTLELPETNKLIDFLSDPTKLATLGFGVVGALLAIVGAIVSFIAFKTKAPSGESNKKVIIVRVVFIGITLLGIVLLSGGVMLPVLTASGKLAILA